MCSLSHLAGGAQVERSAVTVRGQLCPPPPQAGKSNSGRRRANCAAEQRTVVVMAAKSRLPGSVWFGHPFGPPAAAARELVSAFMAFTWAGR